MEHITLNQKLFSKKEILELKLNEENHFNEVVNFLREWFSNSTEIIVQTSGSTGKPKQIAIPKQSFVESAINTCEFLDLDKSAQALLCIPVNYIGGKMMVIRALTQGYNLWIEEPSSSPLTNFGRSVDFLAITPMQAQQILIDSPKKLEQINQVIIGGGAVTQSFINDIKSFKNNFYSTYGMTETVSHIALKRLNGSQKSDSFEVLPSYSISLNEESCIVINCPSLFPGKIITNDIAELT
ncbi:MAG: AMP-binding protein, partial [Flavobacteriales bacterium]|nr:AMP-binding protein [Flavobacteriales bacterium]